MSQNPSGFRRILRFTERRTYPKSAGIPAHFDFHMLTLSRFWFRSFVSWIRGHIRHIWFQYKQQIYKHSYPRTGVNPPEFYTFTCPLCMCHYSQPLSRLEFLSIVFYWLLCSSVTETCVLWVLMREQSLGRIMTQTCTILHPIWLPIRLIFACFRRG